LAELARKQEEHAKKQDEQADKHVFDESPLQTFSNDGL
jgi:hypothetical protein